MSGPMFGRQRAAFSMMVAMMTILSGTAPGLAQQGFDAPDRQYHGLVSIAPAGGGEGAILPGAEVTVTGQGFRPGQQVSLSRGADVLAPAGLGADATGKFAFGLVLSADAAVGTHPLVLTTQAPYHAAVVDLKISPDVPLAGRRPSTLSRRS